MLRLGKRVDPHGAHGVVVSAGAGDHRAGVRIVRRDTGRPICAHSLRKSALKAWLEHCALDAGGELCPECARQGQKKNIEISVAINAGAGADPSPPSSPESTSTATTTSSDDGPVGARRAPGGRYELPSRAEFDFNVYGFDRCNVEKSDVLALAEMASYQRVMQYVGTGLDQSMLLFHATGSGKTRSLWALLAQLAPEIGPNFIFATTQPLVTTKNPHKDVSAYYTTDNTVAMRFDSPPFRPETSRILSFRSLVNAVAGGNDTGVAVFYSKFKQKTGRRASAGSELYKWVNKAKQSLNAEEIPLRWVSGSQARGAQYADELTKGDRTKVDPLRDTAIVIDEADQFFAGFLKSGVPDKWVSAFERAVFHSYEVSGPRAVRLILATATPVTPDTRTTLRMLNLLIRSPTRRARVGAARAFRGGIDPDDLVDFAQPMGPTQLYINALRSEAAISHVAVVDDTDHFPVRIDPVLVPIVASADIAARIKSGMKGVQEMDDAKAEEAFDRDTSYRGTGSGSGDIDIDSEELRLLALAPQIKLRRGRVAALRKLSNFVPVAGDALSAAVPEKARLGHPEFDLDGSGVSEVIEASSPKLQELLVRIAELDAQAQADPTREGLLPKHVIISDTTGNEGAALIGAALIKEGYAWRPAVRPRNSAANVQFVGDDKLVAHRAPVASAAAAAGTFVVLAQNIVSATAEADAAGAPYLQKRSDYAVVPQTELVKLVPFQDPASEEARAFANVARKFGGKPVHVASPDTLDRVHILTRPRLTQEEIDSGVDKPTEVRTPLWDELTSIIMPDEHGAAEDLEELRRRGVLRWEPVVSAEATKAARTDMIRRFNDPGNVEGEWARIIVLGAGFSTGVDLKDVEHVHIVDKPATERDETQQIGRALRRCGHTELRRRLRRDDTSVATHIYSVTGAGASLRKLLARIMKPKAELVALEPDLPVPDTPEGRASVMWAEQDRDYAEGISEELELHREDETTRVDIDYVIKLLTQTPSQEIASNEIRGVLASRAASFDADTNAILRRDIGAEVDTGFVWARVRLRPKVHRRRGNGWPVVPPPNADPDVAPPGQTLYDLWMAGLIEQTAAATAAAAATTVPDRELPQIEEQLLKALSAGLRFVTGVFVPAEGVPWFGAGVELAPAASLQFARRAAEYLGVRTRFDLMEELTVSAGNDWELFVDVVSLLEAWVFDQNKKRGDFSVGGIIQESYTAYARSANKPADDASANAAVQQMTQLAKRMTISARTVLRSDADFEGAIADASRWQFSYDHVVSTLVQTQTLPGATAAVRDADQIRRLQALIAGEPGNAQWSEAWSRVKKYLGEDEATRGAFLGNLAPRAKRAKQGGRDKAVSDALEATVDQIVGGGRLRTYDTLRDFERARAILQIDKLSKVVRTTHDEERKDSGGDPLYKALKRITQKREGSRVLHQLMDDVKLDPSVTKKDVKQEVAIRALIEASGVVANAKANLIRKLSKLAQVDSGVRIIPASTAKAKPNSLWKGLPTDPAQRVEMFTDATKDVLQYIGKDPRGRTDVKKVRAGAFSGELSASIKPASDEWEKGIAVWIALGFAEVSKTEYMQAWDDGGGAASRALFRRAVHYTLLRDYWATSAGKIVAKSFTDFNADCLVGDEDDDPDAPPTASGVPAEKKVRSNDAADDFADSLFEEPRVAVLSRGTISGGLRSLYDMYFGAPPPAAVSVAVVGKEEEEDEEPWELSLVSDVLLPDTPNRKRAGVGRLLRVAMKYTAENYQRLARACVGRLPGVTASRVLSFVARSNAVYDPDDSDHVATVVALVFGEVPGRTRGESAAERLPLAFVPSAAGVGWKPRPSPLIPDDLRGLWSMLKFMIEQQIMWREDITATQLIFERLGQLQIAARAPEGEEAEGVAERPEKKAKLERGATVTAVVFPLQPVWLSSSRAGNRFVSPRQLAKFSWAMHSCTGKRVVLRAASGRAVLEDGAVVAATASSPVFAEVDVLS